ncbi:hypothetical protein [Streptomyces chiangmaiensis]|uniref:Secreted protein n=1 Tax=Streptomyces chiangmaiensis TaxID=766497 RepID=A0ABU7FVA8_9ACTN|nr:hypothetical protein [Streptomyces chiangmaiensis]MED7828035.1 hypothetical protein [Streptomyces chiangmaiensis]
MALLPFSRGPGHPASRPPKNGVFLWACVLALICGATTLLVLLGMPVAAAVTTVSSLALVATQVVNTHQDNRKNDPGQDAASPAAQQSVTPESLGSSPAALGTAAADELLPERRHDGQA